MAISKTSAFNAATAAADILLLTLLGELLLFSLIDEAQLEFREGDNLSVLILKKKVIIELINNNNNNKMVIFI